MDKRIRKFLVIWAILSVGISGFVYASEEIRTLTQTANTWDKITGDWVNAVNQRFSTVGASWGGVMWPWDCHSFTTNDNTTVYQYSIACVRKDNSAFCIRKFDDLENHIIANQ